MSNTNTEETALQRQRVGFYLALVNFIGLVVCGWVRGYYAVVGDDKGDRAFVYASLCFFPVWVLTWIFGFVIVGNSLSNSGRITWHGVGALAMLAVPAIPVAIMVIIVFYQFLRSS